MESLVQHGLRYKFALIVAAAGPMDDQYIRASATFGVLNVAVKPRGDITSSVDPFASNADVRPITLPRPSLPMR